MFYDTATLSKYKNASPAVVAFYEGMRSVFTSYFGRTVSKAKREQFDSYGQQVNRTYGTIEEELRRHFIAADYAVRVFAAIDIWARGRATGARMLDGMILGRISELKALPGRHLKRFSHSLRARSLR
jgi:hypothetical protein